MYILELFSQSVNLHDKILYFVYFVIALVFGITIHEFAHAWTAFKLGDPTPKLTKRISLNPLAHLDPLGTIFLFLAGFGWGKPVLMNPQFFKNKKRDILLTSFAGIIANILIAFVFSIPYRLNVAFNLGLEKYWFFTLFDFIAVLNLLLAAFNVLPLPPLDGSKVLYLFLNSAQITVLERVGPAILFLLIFSAFIFDTNFLSSIISYILNLLLYFVRVFPGSPM